MHGENLLATGWSQVSAGMYVAWESVSNGLDKGMCGTTCM